jgi:hypothetical protein
MSKNMIKPGHFFAILLITIVGFGTQTKKYFEGKVTYKFDFVSKDERIDARNLENIFGDGYTLSFKEGNYYHIYEGGQMEFDIYNKADNKAYFKKRGNDTIFWYDCGLTGDKILKFVLTEKKENILGLACDELVIQFPDKTESHYYNADSIATDPGWFKRFTLDGENLIDEKEKSIYLKNKIDYPSFLFTQTATKISRERIDNKIFQIPPGVILSEQK